MAQPEGNTVQLRVYAIPAFAGMTTLLKLLSEPHYSPKEAFGPLFEARTNTINYKGYQPRFLRGFPFDLSPLPL